MTDKKYKKAEITFCIIACTLGVLFHFVYDWSNQNPAIAPFFPVNESTWEHLKLIYFPVLILSVPEYVILSHWQREDAQVHPHHPGIPMKTWRSLFWSARFLSTTAGMALTVVLFYTYTGVYGKNVDVLNIVLYFISMITVYIVNYRIIKADKKSNLTGSWSLICFLLLILVFAVFSYFPPEIGLFQNPAES